MHLCHKGFVPTTHSSQPPQSLWFITPLQVVKPFYIFPGAQAASPVRLVGIRIDSDPTILRPRPKWAARGEGSIVSRDMGTPPPSKE